MKCQLKPTSHSTHTVRLEFDRVIPPLFPKPSGFPGPLAPSENAKILFWSLPALRARHALRVARGNAGKFPFELVNPVQSYRQLFEQLAQVDGLVEMVDLDRYSLGMEVAGLFDVAEVARKVANQIQRSFYPDEELEWGPGFENPQLEVNCGDEIPLFEEPDADASQGSVTTEIDKLPHE